MPSGSHNSTKQHCPKGHPYSGDNLYVNSKGSRVCRACMRDAVCKWNRENPEKKRANDRDWQQANPEKRLENDRKFREDNPNKVRAYCSKRRALKLEQMGRWPIPEHEFVALLFEIYPKCYYCSDPLDEGYHVEHKIPLSRPEMKPDRFEGLHDFRNVRLSCPDCNLRKGTKTSEEFRRAA